jgi:GT2 family glycosyltransferase
MPEEEAPPVVAVVVAFDPGPWFEECLEALGSQDYPNLSILVVDAGSTDSPASRVAAVLPKAYFRASKAGGFAAAANEALGAVEGASHLLLCHDDVAPAPDAVRKMVEEAFRSNAGIVGPKLVAWHEPDRLLQVGLEADRFGSPVPRVEPGEIDQAQHDEVREVFVAPGGCTLVRADLFEALGGYDPEITLLGEDMDLCWRAQVAGARVVVAPSASVRHLEATAGGVRERPDKRALQRRHELRAVLKDYGLVYRWAIVPQLAVLGLLEMAWCVAVDDRARAREVGGAWRWNIARWSSLREGRRQLRRARRLPDHVVSRQRVPARRLRNFVSARTRRSGSGAGTGMTGMNERRIFSALRPGRRAEAVVAVLALIVVMIFGLRSLLTSTLPVVGGLAPLPSAGVLLARFAKGWTAGGVQLNGPAPPAFGLLGAAGILLFGSMGLLQKVVLLGSVTAGAIGAGRLLAPFGSPRARVVSAAAYVALPLVWDDLAKGDLAATVAFGAAPYVLARLSRAARTVPVAPVRGGIVGEIAGLGLLLAVAGSFAPAFVLVTGAMAAAIAIGGILTGEHREMLRMLAVAVGACAAAFAISFPWAVAFAEGGSAAWGTLLGPIGGAGTSPALADLMRFDVGPFGRGLLGWGLLAAATLPLMVARGERLRTATRWWCASLASIALAWAALEGWLGAGGSATGVLLAPAAAGLAGCVALGMNAYEVDLPRYRFGWRQAVTAAGAVCAVAGAIPFLGATLGGRASLPSVGYEQVLDYLSSPKAPSVPYRVLWLGDPGALPARGWMVAPGYALALSEDGLPDGTTEWPSPTPGAASRIEADVALARGGLTVDVGALLAQFGVRYVVVPSSAAPVLPGIQGAQSLPPPTGIVDGLSLQADLRELPSQAGSTVFVNADWVPGAGPEPLPGAARPPLASLAGGGAAAAETVLFVLALALALRRPRKRQRREPARPAHGRGARRAGSRPSDPPPDVEPELAGAAAVSEGQT